MEKNTESFSSLSKTSWRNQLSVACALMSIIPMLTFGYFILAYLMPNIVTRENIVLVIAINVVLAFAGFRIMRETFRSLSQFKRYLQAVARGDLNQKLSIYGGPEIESIAESIDTIIKELNVKHEKQQLFSKELEKKVKERTKELQKKNTELGSFINNIPDMAWLKDVDSNFIAANKAFGSAVGMDPEYLVNHTCEVCFGTEKAGKFKEDDKKVMASRQQAVIEESIVDAKNNMIWLETIKSPIVDVSGNVVGTVGIARDISKRKKAEEEILKSRKELSDSLVKLKDMQDQVIHHERLSALAGMAGGISHNLNNALMPIVALSQLLLQDRKMRSNEKDLVTSLQNINTAVSEARRIVGNLSKFSQFERGLTSAEVDLNNVIKESVLILEPRWKAEMSARGKVIQVLQEFGRIPVIKADALQLRDVFIGIILNSIDAMPDGGTITIRTYVDVEQIVVEISDTGTGMSEDMQKQCLEPFFSTKDKHSTGMGLAVAAGIIYHHNGTIKIQSPATSLRTGKLGKGTTVSICLPLKQSDAGEQKAPAIPQAVSPGRPMKILVIDDDPRSYNIVKRCLETDKHTVEIAEAGQPGIEKFRNGNFDMVITDRAMPDMNGDMVAQEIKKMAPNVPIIMLTGFGYIMSEKQDRPAGVDLVVSKPVTRDELCWVVAEVASEFDDK